MQAVSEFAETSSWEPLKACLGRVLVLIKESPAVLKLESSILFWKIDSYTEFGFAWVKILLKELDLVWAFNLGQKNLLWTWSWLCCVYCTKSCYIKFLYSLMTHSKIVTHLWPLNHQNFVDHQIFFFTKCTNSSQITHSWHPNHQIFF